MKRTYQIIDYVADWNPNGTLNGKMGCRLRLDVDSAAAELDEVKAMDGTTETITGSLETHVASQAQRETGETLAAGDVEILTVLGVNTSYLTMLLGTTTAAGRALMAGANAAAQRATLGVVVDLIQAQTTSGVSVTDYVTGLTSDYNKLVLDLDDWEPATDGAFPEILFSTDGGSTWAEAAGSYAWVAYGARAGNQDKAGSDSDTKIQLTAIGVSNVAGEGIGGTLVLHGAKSATSRCTMEWHVGHFDVATRLYTMSGHAKRLSDENIDAIRIQASDGNHSVVSALWGIK